MSVLVLLTLIKPNIVLIALLLAASFGALRGAKLLASSAAVAGGVGLVFMVFPCTYFGSWDIWQDWYRYFCDVGGKHFYPVSNGNASTTLIVSDVLNTTIDAAGAFVVCLLLAHALWFLFKTELAKAPVEERLKPALLALLGDPYLCAALGITATLATSPLVWYHYYVLSLMPALWLIVISPRRSRLELLGIISIVMTSGVLPQVLPFLRHGSVRYWLVAGGWLPLWFGIQSEIKARGLQFLALARTKALLDAH
jgi:hypothetical protein